MGGDRLTHAFSNHSGFGLAGTEHQEAKLFPSVATYDVGGPQGVHDQMRGVREDEITRGTLVAQGGQVVNDAVKGRLG